MGERNAKLDLDVDDRMRSHAGAWERENHIDT